MPSLVRTLDRHSTPEDRTPAFKPSSDPDLQVAGLQEHATTPSRECWSVLTILSIGFTAKVTFFLITNYEKYINRKIINT